MDFIKIVSVLGSVFFFMSCNSSSTTSSQGTEEQTCNECEGWNCNSTVTTPYVPGLPLCEDIGVSSSISESGSSTYVSKSSSSTLQIDLTAPVIQLYTAIPDTINNHFVVELDLTDNSDNMTVYAIYNGYTINTLDHVSSGLIKLPFSLGSSDEFWTLGSLVFKASDPSGNKGTTNITSTVIRPSFTTNGQDGKIIVELNYYKEIGSHDAFGGSADADVKLLITSFSRGSMIANSYTTKTYMGKDNSFWTGSVIDSVPLLSYTDSITIKASVIDKDVSSDDDISPLYYLTHSRFGLNTTYSDTLTGGGSNIGFKYKIIEVTK